MSKTKSPQAAAGALADQVAVRLHHQDDEGRTPDQYEILLAGKRIAFLSADDGLSIARLPTSFRGFRLPRLTAAEWEEVAAAARAQAGALIAAATVDEQAIDRLLERAP